MARFFVCLGTVDFVTYCRRLGNRVDDVHSVQTATTDTSSKQDAELDDEVQFHAEFKRQYVYFLFTSSTHVEFVLSGCQTSMVKPYLT